MGKLAFTKKMRPPLKDGLVLRSQATRDRILESARALFATEGYRGATVRQIAAHAQANVALVIRYYGNKESLFAAAASFDLRLPDLRKIERSAVGARLVAHFLDVWEDGPTGQQLVALLKAAATHPAAKARMQDVFHGQLRAAVRAMGLPAAEADTRAALVSSQMLGFALVRYVLEFSVGAMDRQTTVRALGNTIQRYLADPL